MFTGKINSGMTTIEASVIAPVCISVALLVVWLGILYYDKNVLAESASRAAIYGAEHSDWSNEDINKYVQEKL